MSLCRAAAYPESPSRLRPTSLFPSKIARGGHLHVDFTHCHLRVGATRAGLRARLFWPNDEDVLDDTFRKDGFRPFLYAPAPDHTDLVKGYSKSPLPSPPHQDKGRSSSHVDPRHSEMMFGSLVVVFPTPHGAGALLIWYRRQERTFDSATTLPTAPPSSICSDVEHSIILQSRAPAGDLVSVPVSPAQVLANERNFRTAFEALFGNPQLLPNGGTLGFGLQHAYQMSDAAVYWDVCTLGFEPVLAVPVLQVTMDGERFCRLGGWLIDRVTDFECGGLTMLQRDDVCHDKAVYIFVCYAEQRQRIQVEHEYSMPHILYTFSGEIVFDRPYSGVQ
ncbi:hypothetical protein DFH94DRAFT_847528 [Russula ochroleuca]|uniref:Uncharacterized protein n=1 Tax=Russula ochroleuca TaxID=152965 RepID=A0A9P5MMI8_9AGAM|nr:hypothetical protein DFH94DRAFT_847528 [Russula ochroleuca]